MPVVTGNRLERGLKVPFFRVGLADEAVAEVERTLRSGWLTTGPLTRRFEAEFKSAVGAAHAVAVNSCTAALHVAVEALGLQEGEGVLVPSMTFAATAEVVAHCRAVPILVDCDPVTLNIDLADAERKLAAWNAGELGLKTNAEGRVAGVMPMHHGGFMVDVAAVEALASRHGLWTVEDAAHAFPSAWRSGPDQAWRRCGSGTADISCFSFYANKTITTGEGGMATCSSEELAASMLRMSLHGLSRESWHRDGTGRSWDYEIVSTGFKYNMPDISAALGLHELARAEALRTQREAVAVRYLEAFSDQPWFELPPVDEDRVPSWHLFPIRLRLDRLDVDRNRLVERLAERGVGTSVHYRPLHLHRYYREHFGWQPEHCPEAAALWPRLVSLPLFHGMREDEVEHVVATVLDLCRQHDKGPGR